MLNFEFIGRKLKIKLAHFLQKLKLYFLAEYLSFAGLNIGELTLGVSSMAMAPQQGQSQANAQFQPQPQVFSPSLVFLGFLIHVGFAMLDKFLLSELGFI